MEGNSFKTLHTREQVREQVHNQQSSWIHSQLESFMPPGFPQRYPDGRIPLRVQIFQDKGILNSVLTKPKKGVYMCSHCDTNFATLAQMLDHIDEYSIARSYKCSFDDCPWKIVGFSKSRQLKRHISSVHSPTKRFPCDIENCNKSFMRLDLFNRHIRSVHENKMSRFNRRNSYRTSSITGGFLNSGSRKGSVCSTISTNSNTSSQGSNNNSPGDSPSFTQSNSYKHSISFLTNNTEEEKISNNLDRWN